MYHGITLQGMRQKVFVGKFEIVLYLGSTKKGQIIMQNLAFRICGACCNASSWENRI